MPYRFLFLEIPNPLSPDQRMLIGSRDKFRSYLEHLAYQASGRRFDVPLLRIDVQSAFSTEGDTKEIFGTFIKNCFNTWRKRLLNLLYQDYFYLVLFAVFAYVMWNVGFIAKGVDFLFTLGGDYLNPYAHTVLVLSPIIYAVYQKLLSGNTVFKKRRGIVWLQKMEVLFEEPLWERVRRKASNMVAFTDNSLLKKRLKELCLLLKAKDCQAVAKWLSDFENTARNTTLSWPEKELLEDFSSELIFLTRNNFMSYETRWESSSPLLEFYVSEDYRKWQAQLAALAKRLEEAPSAFLYQQMADLFWEMKGKIHLQLVEHLPEEIFAALVDYYHRLYLFFARLSRYKGELKRFSAGRWREFLSNPDQEPLLGKNVALKSFAVIAFVLCIFCLHLVGEKDFLVVERLSPGFKSTLGREVTIVDDGIKVGNLKLLLSPPRPFAFTYRRTSEVQKVGALLILKEVEPVLGEGFWDKLKYWWERTMAFFKQGYGTDFVVLKFNCSVQISKPELWKGYDFDGKGMDRLARDLEVSLSSVYERVMSDLRMNLLSQSSTEEIEKYLQVIFERPSFKEWIRRLLYPSPLDTYRVGSIYDMYLTGLEWLRRHPRMEQETEWRDFVEHEMEVVRENLQREHTQLIASPQKVRGLITSPSLEKFIEYPGLYQTLFYLAVNEIVNNRVVEELNLERSELRQKLEEEALNYLQDKDVFLHQIGVQVNSVKVSLERVSYLRYMRLLQRRQNLI